MNLSIAQRELRLAAHSVRVYRFRTWIAAGGIVGSIWAFLGFGEIGQRSPYLLGQAVFVVSAWAVFCIAGAGFGATADAVSVEKRAGTLGLLFLTHLKGRDVILGKLLANSLKFFAGVVALFPILAGPILLGGVTFGQSVRLFVAIANMMLFSAAAGLLASTFCLREQVAQSKALQIVLLFAVGFPLTARILRYFGFDSSLCLALELASPLYAHQTALGGVTGPQPGWFCFSAVFVLLTSCAMLAIAAWFIPHSWQEGARMGLMETILERLRGALKQIILARSRIGAALLDRNAFEWLAVRDQSLRRAVWLIIVVTVLLVVGLDCVLSLFWPRAGFSMVVCPTLLFLLLSLVKVRAGRLAVTHIAHAKEQGILEAIVASRLRFSDIIAAQFRALRNLLAWPLLALIPVCLAAYIYCLPGIDRLADSFTSPPEIGLYRFRAFFIVIVALVFLFLDPVALTWAGMLCGFKASRASKACAWTDFLVLAVPNTLFLALLVFLLQFHSIRPYLEHFYPPVGLWIGLKVATDLVVIAYSRAWLLHAARPSLTTPLEQFREAPFFPTRKTVREFLKANLAFLARPNSR